MNKINKCIICNSADSKKLFSKKSETGDLFTLVQCTVCGLQYLSDPPSEKQIAKYYKKNYFTKRTERGYDNYFSEKIKKEIERVFTLNLEDLNFFNFEQSLKKTGMSLDIGCAAGYFVNYLKNRGWKSSGIDVSKDCIDFALKHGLNAELGDYLAADYKNKFNLITMWASIEHLHRPDKFLTKIYNDLTPEGMLMISTCRADGFNFMKLFGPKWRFYNFPEHIHFFSEKTLKILLNNCGFKIENYKTYGSNIGKGGTVIRKIADIAAKKLNIGDMMIISAKKI